MKTILVPLDFSRTSKRVVAEAAKLSQAFGARLVLMHSVPPSPIIATDLMPLIGPALMLTSDVEKSARHHLERMQRALAKKGTAADVVSTSGFPVTQIVAEAKKRGAQYVVLGSHGHTAFYDLVLGSTASGVLKRSPCPVVIVPAEPKKGAAVNGNS